MSLRIQRVSLDDFRGYSHFELAGLGRLTVVAGPNAVGKTNIIEGIQLLTSAESFRKPSWGEVVSWGREQAILQADFVDGVRSVEHVLRVVDGKRHYEVNGKKRGTSTIRGTLPAVLFIPDDLQMVKASSARRRAEIDSFAAQLSKNYESIRKEYAQVLRQRNLLIREDMAAGPLFDSWNESLVVHGSRLCANRIKLFRRLASHMKRIYADVVEGEDLDARYLPCWQRFDEQGRQLGDVAQAEGLGELGPCGVEEVQGELEGMLGRLSFAERQRRTSLVGPQKDEIAFFINGRNARLFASQGQQRTIVLVWKLAEVALVEEILGVKPVLLLDDVMSELDSTHREQLTSFIEQAVQTVITTTNLGYFTDQLLEQAKIVEVPQEGTRYSY